MEYHAHQEPSELRHGVDDEFEFEEGGKPLEVFFESEHKCGADSPECPLGNKSTSKYRGKSEFYPNATYVLRVTSTNRRCHTSLLAWTLLDMLNQMGLELPWTIKEMPDSIPLERDFSDGLM
ncbi:hypothetical protein AVEN_90652-1 [Araneus ventricosus]|uniref:Uncharacterized protein n=1 Tax=Araneus ventricosus TaxID=182803 RepID=A0A4Y2HK00_ARAVE|nr:hypothetical protein AVEN_90652-1 [Araneus ventricosus]